MKRGTPNLPKMYALAETLGVPRPMAVGIMEMLWHHTAASCPRGDIGSLPDVAIAAAVGWPKKPSVLIDALCKEKWLDRDEEFRLIIHDWPEHAEYEVVRKLLGMKKDFIPIYGVSVHDRKKPEHSRAISEHPRANARNVRADVEHPRASREALAYGSSDLNTSNTEDLSVLAREVSDSGKDSPRATRWKFDEGYMQFVEGHRSTGGPSTDSDFAKGYYVWPKLDYTQQLAACDHVKTCDGAFVKLPQNYLADREWERPTRPAPMSKLERTMRDL